MVVEDELSKLSKTLPEFRNDFNRLISYLASEVKLLGNLEVDHRRLKTKHTKQMCEDQVAVINQSLNYVHKMYVLTILSQ